MENKEKISEALEQARCSLCNLENLGNVIPLINDHPFFKIVHVQIEETISLLESYERE